MKKTMKKYMPMWCFVLFVFIGAAIYWQTAEWFRDFVFGATGFTLLVLLLDYTRVSREDRRTPPKTML